MKYAECRNEIIEWLSEDLLGPGSDRLWGGDASEEIITEHPRNRYSIGILYKRDDQNGQPEIIPDEEKTKEPSDEYEENEDSTLDEKEEDTGEDKRVKTAGFSDTSSVDADVINAMSQFAPSAMGMTFFVKEGQDEQIQLQFNAACYASLKPSDDWELYAVDFRQSDGSRLSLPEDMTLPQWLMIEDDVIRFSRAPGPGTDDYGQYDTWKEQVFEQFPPKSQDGEINWYRAKVPFFRLRDQVLHGYRRTAIEDPDLTLADLLAKGKEGCALHKKDEKAQLCCRAVKRPSRDGLNMISVYLYTEKQGETDFYQCGINVSGSPEDLCRFPFASEVEDEEEQMLAMLYRNKPKYGVGHGCSVNWNVDEDNAVIQTTFLPKQTVFRPDYEINAYGSADKGTLNEVLKLDFLIDSTREQVVDRLKGFCGNYEAWIKQLKSIPGFEKCALKNRENCGLALKRMLQGVDVLDSNDVAWEAFQLMNKAIRTMQIQQSKTGKCFPWRPFQLAFILLTIPSIVDRHDEYRRWVDLLWFATGGGKTEAYLGIIGFTIFNRRLSMAGVEGGGTAVIMRYTLRLLTSQQFTRASGLICACELLRKKDQDRLGKEEINIGLWVGGGDDGIPNKVADAKTELDKIKSNRRSDDPFQPVKCPWCKGELDRSAQTRGTIFRTSCKDPECEFHKGLPVQVIDECLYKKAPTLLFATVDKFAQMPWKKEVGKFFGLQDNGKRKYHPPELIVQDELHLISSELGSIVGLYECALHNLCRKDAGDFVYPKVVASTATARRAKEQVQALYACDDMLQFPPSGTDIEDSYFSKEDQDSKGRLYVALMSAGKTASTMLIRCMANMMQRVSECGWNNKYKDQFYTLVSYFNSLRELGSCETWLHSDISERMKVLANLSGHDRRWINKDILLCGRAKSGDIPGYLDLLEKELTDDDSFRPVDVVLSSNMLSVGIDVDRFGMMAVYGQPKTTSEYIQCTSRVGRNNDGSGLVLTVYNGMKPRDRSHFEIYPDYIQSFYRYVEPASLTPFSVAARKKALHAVLVSMVRHLYAPMNTDPSSLLSDDMDLDELQTRIEEWAKTADHVEYDAVVDALKELVAEWQSALDMPRNVNRFGSMPGPNGPPASTTDLCCSHEQGSPELEPGEQWELMTSCRNVDQQCFFGVTERV